MIKDKFLVSNNSSGIHSSTRTSMKTANYDENKNAGACC